MDNTYKEKFCKEIIKENERKLKEDRKISQEDLDLLKVDIGYVLNNLTNLATSDIEEVDYKTIKTVLLAVVVRQKNIENILIKLLEDHLKKVGNKNE